MMSPLLLCPILLLGFLAGGRAETQYLLSIPASLASGNTAKACMNIIGNKENVDLRLVLEHNGQNTSIISQDVSSPTYFQCAEFQVPNVSEAVPVAVILSVIGKNTEIRERKSVVLNPTKTNCAFQMDKPIYRPGQSVRCRIICLDSQLKAVSEKFPVVYLQDPSRTRIVQWLQPECDHGVVSLEFQLIKDAPVGSYSFQVERESGYPMSKYFTVDEYVAPRFAVKMDAPNTVSVLDEWMNVTVSAMYTYGEPVAGAVTVRYCKEPSFYGRRQNCIRDRGDRCFNMTGVLGPDGVYNGKIDLSDTFMGSTGRSMRFEATVTEVGTGIQTTESHYTWVSSQPASLSFDYDAMNQNYKRGLPYHVVAKLSNERDQPISGQDIEIALDGKVIETVQTDSDGKIDYAIDTTDMVAPNFTIKISYTNSDQCYYAEWRDTDYPTVDYTVYRFYSRSGSFLQAKYPRKELSCGQDHTIDIQYIINPAGVENEATKVPMFYLVLSKSKIVHSGKEETDIAAAKNGSFSIVIPVSADMAPNSKLVVYSILKKELIVETVDLNVERCFKNQVSMTFGQEKTTPGSEAEALLQADPKSICGLRVVDKSLFLLNSYESFSADSILNALRIWFFGYNVAGYDVEDPAPPCEDPDKLIFFNGQYYLPASSSSTERDSYENIKAAGLVFATDVQVRKPEVCDKNPREQAKHPIAMESVGFGGANFKADVATTASRAASASIETVRSNFAESFMWVMVPLDGEGRASVKEKTPDTITKWQGSAFCVSDQGGFGMTRYPVNITTSLPFFVELTTPYSMIRGETLILPVVVHNYLDKCVKVKVTLEPSEAYTAVLKEGTPDACICSNGHASFSWEIQAQHLGDIAFTASAETTFIGQSCDGPNDASQPSRKDTMVKPIIVEAEGIKQERTLTDLVLVQNSKSVLSVSITPPTSVVPDSISGFVSTAGDIFGVSVTNLHNLVQLPTGCAEQSLSRVSSIPHVLKYLNTTGQLTDEVLQKAKGYMTQGYYRHSQFADGSAYRVFPNYGEQPNSWLTVYSFATFENFKDYIYIDTNRQQQTLLWLENMQRLDNGCFKPQGGLFINQDVDDSLHLTSFVAISLMQSKYSLGMTLLDGAMECLKSASTKDQKTADEAIMLYAFSLAKLEQQRDQLLQKLMKKAIIEGGTMHWQREDMPEGRPVPFFLPPFAPAEVAMTCYILLSLTALPTRSEEQMKNMAQTSLWVTRQMNAHGSFGSTLDTNVAIQALAAVAQIMHTPNSQQTVTVRRGDAEIARFDVKPENRLVVQRKPLPDANGGYSIDVEGNGWSLIQTTVGYNIPIPQENSAFSLALSTTSENCINGVAHSFNISVTLSYHGSKNVSNMALARIRMVSGYTADHWSMRQLVKSNVISKYEEENGSVLIYLNSVSQDPITFSIRTFMGSRVLNLKSSSCEVFDYYEPGENGYASYYHPCTGRKD